MSSAAPGMPQPGIASRCGALGSDQAADLALQRIDAFRQSAAVRDQLGGDGRDRAVVLGEGLGDAVQDAQSAQAAGGDGQLRVEFVQEPAQLVANGGALSDQGAPVVHQQLDVPARPVQ
ncbi:hypothetical protein ACFYW6_39875 [Streptomyces sp. NPDC002659]|uniref:hypothetical protein n=1 Tax=Streptomyces sp. NPDC002659 TaxID=3364656 RepID=UPI0036BC1519